MAKAEIKVDGVEKVVKRFQGMSLKGKKVEDMVVGYTAPYAVYVHEDLTKRHTTGQAKFLEQPARVHMKTMQFMLVTALKNKEGLRKSLIRVGNFLLRESKKLVPVKTGFLRDSGFVRVV